MATRLGMPYEEGFTGHEEIAGHIRDTMFGGDTGQRADLLAGLREIRTNGEELLDNLKLDPFTISYLAAVSTLILVEGATVREKVYSDTIDTLCRGLLGNPAVAKAVFCNPELAFVMIPYNKKLTDIATQLQGEPVTSTHNWEQSGATWDNVRGVGDCTVELYGQNYRACLFSQENMIGNEAYTRELGYSSYPYRYLLLHEGAHLLHLSVLRTLTLRDLGITGDNWGKGEREGICSKTFGDPETGPTVAACLGLGQGNTPTVLDMTAYEVISSAYQSLAHFARLRSSASTEPAYIWPDGTWGCYASQNEFEYFAQYVNMCTGCQMRYDTAGDGAAATLRASDWSVGGDAIATVARDVKERRLLNFANDMMCCIVEAVTSRMTYEAH